MLEEMGEPYDMKRLKMSEDDSLKPGYLVINPMGKTCQNIK
jgi:glutathione S-transferase